MPLFFFNRMDGKVELDREGTELVDLDAAREEAIIFLGNRSRTIPACSRAPVNSAWKSRARMDRF